MDRGSKPQRPMRSRKWIYKPSEPHPKRRRTEPHREPRADRGFAPLARTKCGWACTTRISSESDRLSRGSARVKSCSSSGWRRRSRPADLKSGSCNSRAKSSHRRGGGQGSARISSTATPTKSSGQKTRQSVERAAATSCRSSNGRDRSPHFERASTNR